MKEICETSHLNNQGSSVGQSFSNTYKNSVGIPFNVNVVFVFSRSYDEVTFVVDTRYVLSFKLLLKEIHSQIKKELSNRV